jgi:tetratricopeptide (TPR) repeat protein
MTEPSSAQVPQSSAAGPGPAAHPPMGAWERLKHHKVLQWTLAYAAASYTLLHATQMIAESFEWPHLIVRLTAIVLALGVPIVVLLGWRAASLTLQNPLPHALVDAERDAEQAIALDPDLAQAHAALAEVKLRRGDWVAAAVEYHKALAADPADARIRGSYGMGLLASGGQMREALAETQTAYRLAPADMLTVMMNSSMHSLNGIDAAAVHLAGLATALGLPNTAPPFPDIFASAARRSGHYDEAARILTNQANVRFPGPDSAEVNQLVYEAFGDPAKVPRAVAALRDLVGKFEPAELDA